MPAHHHSLPPDKEQLALQFCRISRNARVSSELFTTESFVRPNIDCSERLCLLQGGRAWKLASRPYFRKQSSAVILWLSLRCCCSATAVQRANARPTRSTPYRKKHW